MKKLLILTFLLAGALLLSSESDQDSPKIHMLIFLSENCEICDDFQMYKLPDLESKFHLEYTLYYDYEDDAKALLSEIEKQFGKIEEFPIILMGNKLIKGEEIYSKLETSIGEYANLGGCCVPLLFDFEETQESSDKFPIHIAYIYGNDPEAFEKATNYFDELKEKYPLLEIKKYDFESEEGKQMNDTLCRFYHIAEKNANITPKIFIGNEVLIAEQVNFDSIKMLIERYQDAKDTAPWEKILRENKGE